MAPIRVPKTSNLVAQHWEHQIRRYSCLITHSKSILNRFVDFPTLKHNLSHRGRITPSELLQQYGLERSLSAAYNDHSILGYTPTTTAAVSAANTVTVTRGTNMSWNASNAKR